MRFYMNIAVLTLAASTISPALAAPRGFWYGDLGLWSSG